LQLQASVRRVFGFSFFEIVVILLVAVVVVGPRQLPTMLRTAGRWVSRIRRMAFDMREQSGIDELLRDEGLEQDIRQLRALLSKGNVLNALAIDLNAEMNRTPGMNQPKLLHSEVALVAPSNHTRREDHEREYPAGGVDAYEVTAIEGAEDVADPYRIAVEEAKYEAEQAEKQAAEQAEKQAENLANQEALSNTDRSASVVETDTDLSLSAKPPGEDRAGEDRAGEDRADEDRHSA
jgi:sec-independent protein translocase protein TatB